MKHRSNYLGEQLVRSGIISRDQLEEALALQNERLEQGDSAYLGNIILEQGYCSDEELARVLARKHNVPYFNIEDLELDEKVVRLIPRSTANRYKMFPVKLEGNTLLVAMKHPEDISAIDDLRMITGRDIQPVLIKDSDLETLINKVSSKYGEEIESFDFFKQPGQIGLAARDEKLVLSPGQTSSYPSVELLNKVLSLAVQEGTNDVHIEPLEDEMKIRFRIDGVLQNRLSIAKEYLESLVSRVKVLANMDITETRIPQDGRMSVQKDGELIDVRVASLPSYYGERITLRLLFHEPGLLNLNRLGFNDGQLQSFREYICYPYGFMVVSGPTGSGKSTTLYAALTEINTENRNIITIEDPVEKKIRGINQVPYNRKAGLTFYTGLRSILRNHPDVIMVGEIRDAETGTMATESALTGHLVMSTIHAGDSAKAVVHLLDMGVPPYLVESSLTCVLSQRLLRKLCRNCVEKYCEDTEELLRKEPEYPVNEDRDKTELYRAIGCSMCDQTGYMGRTGVFELLTVSGRIRSAVREVQSAQTIREIAVDEGMVPLRYNGLQRVKEGITSLEEFKRIFV